MKSKIIDAATDHFRSTTVPPAKAMVLVSFCEESCHADEEFIKPKYERVSICPKMIFGGGLHIHNSQTISANGVGQVFPDG